MFILFVSDVHLCNNKPYIVQSFINFLHNQAIHAQALYILGDLFEIWIGDDDPNPLHIEISNALQYLYRHHTPCYFIHGNHDFLLGNTYAINCGITLLPSKNILEFLGHRIIILHGDTLCINDNNYQRFRKYTRQMWLQKIFLSLPLSTRLYISRIIQNNKKHNNVTSDTIDQKKIKKILLQTNTDFMIHGHIHQAKKYYTIVDDMKKLERIVLGNWKNTGSVVEINKNGIFLNEITFKK
ncbi:UDP-2,3-diacylglucosamine diphosphatase [Blochmannia endosymbiont of Polyrhachis (Hedomyrma) turneri]|uniref:UDP-2,3-diacylglucosamine diphosphatase n=1 Tax=Blochmannia endosymbiont of Polyrhachis (Hedomyrma) turneri TaxID=1505596 RepID=UPI00061A6FF5|nr:UDP-2,3-diacylglucosamine diphosphatase [Blochmannia endosymbiont of Polyrhachis (Hedomyrma) turneri]AKC59875.1 UDP-2,3-diacylglucosamine hydrolase [Blochmannia endosymbiont of Polyrhachis (Hedomyrma) turneri]